jgi:coenzyme F420-dependent glucose-6-phosphate dehydrogenase
MWPMTKIGYHASHEQFTPRELLDYVQIAESVGFDAAMSSDHFQPWSERQGQSGYSWAWMGAAMHATDLPFGTVCAPGGRHHPAIVAQASATLAQMFPERFWIALGSGEAMNEHITGEGWPSKAERNARLKECVDIIRARARRRGQIVGVSSRAADDHWRGAYTINGRVGGQLGGWLYHSQQATRGAPADG